MGLWTIGASGNISISILGYGGTVGINFVADSKWNFEIQLVTGGGGNTNISIGGSLDLEVSNAECVSDLTGIGYQGGIDYELSIKRPFYIEVGTFGGHVPGKGNYQGLYGGLGIGKGRFPGSHGLYMTKTKTLFKFNLKNKIKSFFEWLIL